MKRFVFIVQGEGRGHLSQALAMMQIVEKTGGRVEAVYAGCSRGNALPEYFVRTISDKLRIYKAPGFIPDRRQTGVKMLRTFIRNFFLIPVFLKQIKALSSEIVSLSPDTVINFYEINGALAMRRFPSSIRRIAVAHHFWYSHPDAVLPGGFPLQRRLLQWHNRIVIRSSDIVLALSFRPAKDSGSISIVPPLIADEVRALNRKTGSADLAYFLYPGFADRFIKNTENIPGYQADIFITGDRKPVVPDGITIHKLDRKQFVFLLAGCRYLVTTAGFETVAEAAYLGVPVLTVATGNHFEQECNALDMQLAGIGMTSAKPDPGELTDFVPGKHADFKEWADKAFVIISNRLS